MTEATATAGPGVAGSAASTVTLPVVRSYVQEAQDKNHRRGVIGLRARPEWTGPDSFEVDGQTVRVVPCVSALAVREALAERDRAGWLVILTDRPEGDLGQEVLAHLVEQRLRSPVLWDVVRDRFQARDLDPRLVHDGREVAQALLAASPPDGWPPVRGGYLSRDAAFEALAARVLDLPADRLDEVGLLEWTQDAGAVAGLDRLAPTVRERVTDWLGSRLGPIGAALIDATVRGHAGDAVALGLVAGLLAADDVRVAESRGAFAAAYLGRPLGWETARRWAEVSRAVVERLLPAHVPGASLRLDRVLSRAQEILAEVGVPDLAERSDVLPAGLAALLRRLAASCEAVEGPEATRATLPAAEDAYERLARHVLADRYPESTRVARAQMELRLLRWLAAGEPSPPATLAAAVDRHLREDAWVDRARAHVWAGDADRAVAAAYRRVYDVASARRERRDERFADLLAAHTAAGAEAGGVVHVEDVLDSVARELMRRMPVLLLVVDGMSAAVATELAEGLAASGWVAMVPAEGQHPQGALAALPTVTEVSRTSLFAGALTRGHASDESTALATWARRHATTATVFHKGDLDAADPGEELPPLVRAAVDGTQEHRVVAAVLNAVDDSLDKGDPGRPLWGPERVTHLAELMRAAERAVRAVILTADHGHVVERRDGERRAVPGQVSARWRPADGPPPGYGEVALKGRRVLLGSGRVVAAWRETLRYTQVKAGYHGGASAAEVVVPLTVLVHATRQDSLRGWQSVSAGPTSQPRWWHGLVPSQPVDREPVATAPPVTAIREAGPGDLAGAVMASAAYADQRRRSRRGSLPDAEVGRALRGLLASGGELAVPTFASVVGFPEYRLTGKIAALQRLLNVEGYEVVRHDADAGRVVLDERLLRQQFGLGDD